MKIAVILESAAIDGGGGHQGLSATKQLLQLSNGQFEVIATTSVPENVIKLQQAGLRAILVKNTWRDRGLLWLAMSPWGRRLGERLKWIGGLERALEREQVDIAYFAAPSWRTLTLQRINYITTVWDLCHRDTPEFPEVRSFNTFHGREFANANTLPAALLVIADSATLADRIARRYGVDRERILAMPFSAAPFVEATESRTVDDVLRAHGLDAGYFFYPAQFWPHKNHVRIIQALALMKAEGAQPVVVFAGGDKGNQTHIAELAAQLGVARQVRFLGFVPDGDMRGLYEGCATVVMPTYFGPTNLPPLECWALGRPLIYSRELAAQAGEAALLVNPDDAAELAGAMKRSLDPVVRAELVARGRLRQQALDAERQSAEQELGRRLIRFARLRQCWH